MTVININPNSNSSENLSRLGVFVGVSLIVIGRGDNHPGYLRRRLSAARGGRSACGGRVKSRCDYLRLRYV